jgi:tetratricopeptide (TPR) repeat protein
MQEYAPPPNVTSLMIAGLRRARAGDLPGARESFSHSLAGASASGPTAEAHAAQLIASALVDIQLSAMACEYYVQSANVARRSGDKELISIFCGNAGKALLDSGSPELSIDFFRDAAAAYEVTADPVWHAQTLTTWGCALEDLHRYQDARAKHAEARDILEELPNPDYPLLSDVWANEANAYALDGKGPQALEARRAAMNRAILSYDVDRLKARMDYLAFDLRKFEPETTDADISAEFGAVYYHSRILDVAADFFKQAIASSTSESRKAEWLGALVDIRIEQGQADKALEAGLQCLQLLRHLKDAKGEAHICGRLGSVYVGAHRWDEAERCFQMQMESAVRAGDTEQRVSAFGNLGTLDLLHGRYARAIEFLKIQRTEAVDEYLRANAALGLGTAYISLGAPGRAMPLLEDAVRSLKKIGRPGSAAAALNNLGTAWKQLGDAKRALRSYQDSIALAASETADPVIARQTVLKAKANLAMLELDRGEYPAARAGFEAAAKLAHSEGDSLSEVRIPRDADQRSELMSITIPK